MFPLPHEQDMEANRSSQDFKVNVKVNAAPPADLGKILAEIREDYEAIIEKNRQSLDNWYKEQVPASPCSFPSPLWLHLPDLSLSFSLASAPQSAAMSLAATPNPEQIQRNENEIKELRRTLQSLDIELQAQISKVSAADILGCSLTPSTLRSCHGPILHLNPQPSITLVQLLKYEGKWNSDHARLCQNMQNRFSNHHQEVKKICLFLQQNMRRRKDS